MSMSTTLARSSPRQLPRRARQQRSQRPSRLKLRLVLWLRALLALTRPSKPHHRYAAHSQHHVIVSTSSSMHSPTHTLSARVRVVVSLPQAAAAAAPAAAAAGRAVGSAAAAGWNETKEVAGTAGAAVAGAAGAGWNEARDAAGYAGGVIRSAAGDVYNSGAVQSIAAGAWGGIDDAYAMSRETIEAAMAIASGIGTQCFDFVKFDIVRDFFQTIGLFFASLASPAMAEAKALWVRGW